MEVWPILGISATSDKELIKRAYHKRALEWHPDRNHGKGTKRFQQLEEVYHTVITNLPATPPPPKAAVVRTPEWFERRQLSCTPIYPHPHVAYVWFLDGSLNRAEFTAMEYVWSAPPTLQDFMYAVIAELVYLNDHRPFTGGGPPKLLQAMVSNIVTHHPENGAKRLAKMIQRVILSIVPSLSKPQLNAKRKELRELISTLKLLFGH
jgi:hypothetical protein